MKIALTILSLMLFIGVALPVPAYSLTAASDGQLIATFPIQVNFGRNTDGSFYTGTAQIKGSVITAIGTFRNAAGQIEYRIATDAIRFEGDNNLINDLPTALAYEWLAEEAVLQGSIRGYNPIATNCSAPTLVKVLAESCVTRTWLGTATRITPCPSAETVAWQYAVCAQSAGTTPNVVRMPYENSFIACVIAGSQCEATCPDQAQGGVSFR